LSAAIDILHLFPELTAIGEKDLQVYCDEWLSRPMAREFGIAQIVVDERLLLTVNLDAERVGFVGDNVFIPIDELLGYMIDRHFQESDKRRRLHASVRETRERWSELHRDYEATIGRSGMLYLVCKNADCRATLTTSHRGFEGQVVECPPCDVTCPVCAATHVYEGSDLQLKLD
jgi:hypothetical protein